MDKRRAAARQTQALEDLAKGNAALQKEVKALKALVNKVLKALESQDKS